MLRFGRVRELVARRSGRRRRGSRTDPVPAPAARRSVAPVGLPAPDLQELAAQARYHRDRLALYRARVLSAKPASAARLRDLNGSRRQLMPACVTPRNAMAPLRRDCPS
jgi:hypothetical protein